MTNVNKNIMDNIFYKLCGKVSTTVIFYYINRGLGFIHLRAATFFNDKAHKKSEDLFKNFRKLIVATVILIRQ